MKAVVRCRSLLEFGFAELQEPEGFTSASSHWTGASQPGWAQWPRAAASMASFMGGVKARLSGGIVVMVLFYRMASNGAKIVPLAAGHKKHWAVTGWLVPILHFKRPYTMVSQI